MNLLIITTGGTIGSAFDGSSIDVCGACPPADQYRIAHPDDNIDIISPLNLLSEELAPEDMAAIARELYSVDKTAYDGVILTCGSDTLAYIAALCGLIGAELQMPIMVAACNMVLSDPRSNGFVNFDCAAHLIRAGVRGVLVPYRNANGVMTVHEATAVRQADGSDDFYSLFDDPYAVYDGELRPLRPYRGQTIPRGVFSAACPPDFSGRVTAVHPYPGMDYRAIPIAGAVLHMLYHSGTLDARHFGELVSRAGDAPIYLCPLRTGRRLYRTTADALHLGARGLYDISPECAYIKLMLALCQDKMSVTAFMEG